MLFIAACDENGDFTFPTLEEPIESSPAVSGQTTELIERDVEAPEVFQVTEQGLWDGRPSLGGVWVAFPDVAEPERVIIRSQANGQFVIGALFRRERENPGPALQVSSDAAAALGMLAGSPATLNVTALRREETPVPEIAVPSAEFEIPDEISETPLEPIAGAAAAIEAAVASEAASVESVAEPPPAAPNPAATTTSPLERPYIQIGIFSVEENANNSAVAMRTAGLQASVVRQESQGSTFWRVIVGPAQSSAERERLLAQVKDRGFTDAYFVRN
ncbi:SPOR domain-containing protein [Flavimaricola marinus]|uniref:SPOR domain-containing protein n=1 Tax=Flavimaricola marinus TaxID=1819565 RepID=UPI0035208713